MTMRENYAKLHIDKKKRTIVLKELRQLHLERITAGIHASDGKEVVSNNGFKLIDVAVQNEYGNSWVMPKTVRFFKNGKWWIIKKGTKIKIPATHFVTRIIQDPMEKMNVMTAFKASLHILLNYGKYGYTVRDLIKNVGSTMRDAIKSSIDRRIFESNTPLTMQIKGFDKRLFEKGRLYNAIKYRSKKAKAEG